ncbi:peptidase S8/S53 domain-containing protein [Sordaria brevicollis]|uniref:Peptidase S8/S53 domain-containing protein n=1 Tax=Sordaria brevicollis TaxID=83679 RepID=A0AAE0U0F4_SORBR|nr:peptidase S8/S53 domain-containing protein [Sordaria brevicollis]
MVLLQIPTFILGLLALNLGVTAVPFPGHHHAHRLDTRTVPDTHALHERALPHWGRKWEKREPVSPNTVLPMRIGLKQANLDKGHDLLMDISDPKSPNYGQHLSRQEVVDMFSPDTETVEAVKKWIISSGIPKHRISRSENSQWLQFDAKVTEAEDLLYTTYHIYKHIPTGSKTIACDHYHVPLHVRDHVDYITPGIKLRPDPAKVRNLNRRNQQKRARHVRTQESEKRRRQFRPTYNGMIRTGFDELPPLNESTCYKYVTPECIRTQYGLPEGTTATPGNELGIFESLNDHYVKEDLDAYFSSIYPKIPNGTYPIERLIDGAIGAARTPSEYGTESNLDFQAAWPLIWPQKTVLYQTDDQYYEKNQTDKHTPFKGFWNTFFDALDGSYCTYSAFNQTGDCTDASCLDPIYPNPFANSSTPASDKYEGPRQCGLYEPTPVISISYGGGEGDLPASYLQCQCSEILKLGLQGITVVMASGDYGVGSYPGDDGHKNGCAGPDGKTFYPSSDATCPYVLAVGSTEWLPPSYPHSTNLTNSSEKLTEIATTNFPSGGGFSNVFPLPSYQLSAVSTYLSRVTPQLNFTSYSLPYPLPNNFTISNNDSITTTFPNITTVGKGGKVFNSAGRGYPDVSAVGHDFLVRVAGGWGAVGGTSLAAPVWGAVLTLVVEERMIKAGRGKRGGRLGFVNPLFYAHPEIFNDVTKGSNPACHSSGFLATEGWDPVTGLGTPNFPKLLDLLMSLP